MIFLHGGPEGQARPGYNDIFSQLVNDGIVVLTPNVRGSGGFGKTFVHADDKEKRFAAIDDVADCARFLVDNGLADPRRIACAGWSYGGLPDAGGADVSSRPVRGGNQHLRDE